MIYKGAIINYDREGGGGAEALLQGSEIFSSKFVGVGNY